MKGARVRGPVPLCSRPVRDIAVAPDASAPSSGWASGPAVLPSSRVAMISASCLWMKNGACLFPRCSPVIRWRVFRRRCHQRTRRMMRKVTFESNTEIPSPQPYLGTNSFRAASSSVKRLGRGKGGAWEGKGTFLEKSPPFPSPYFSRTARRPCRWPRKETPGPDLRNRPAAAAGAAGDGCRLPAEPPQDGGERCSRLRCRPRPLGMPPCSPPRLSRNWTRWALISVV